MTYNPDADPHSVHERLWKAMEHLAVDDASLKERLDRARLQLIVFRGDECPTPAMQRAFADLMEKLELVRNGEGDQKEAAKALFVLYSGVCERGIGMYDDEHFESRFPER
jgi:hypothetical protein